MCVSSPINVYQALTRCQHWQDVGGLKIGKTLSLPTERKEYEEIVSMPCDSSSYVSLEIKNRLIVFVPLQLALLLDLQMEHKKPQ